MVGPTRTADPGMAAQRSLHLPAAPAAVVERLSTAVGVKLAAQTVVIEVVVAVVVEALELKFSKKVH